MSTQMAHPNMLVAGQTSLVVVDIQEKFGPAIESFESIVRNAVRLIEGFTLLRLPVVSTEQYPRGLGATVGEVAKAMAGAPVFEKTSFACGGAPGFNETIAGLGVRHVVVCGIETHVCVNQTAHALLAQGYRVHLALDALGSRTQSDHQAGIRKMEAAGALPASVEMCLFELMQDAAHEKFKEIHRIIK